jgi:ribonuclease P protein component
MRPQATCERPRLARLKRRSEFLRAAGRGRKWATPGLVLQAYTRDAGDGRSEATNGARGDRPGACVPAPEDRAEAHREARVGFTASRKVGNAVARNRARRRLKAAAAEVLPRCGKAGTDYVLIARAGTLTRPYMDLVGDLRQALQKVEERRRPRPRRSADKRTDGRTGT